MSLAPRFVFGDLDLTDYPFAVMRGDAVDLGAPETVVDILQSLMPDGEIESLSRRTNRTLQIPLIIESSDLGAMADAEAALAAECRKARNTFSIDPGDGFGPTTIFDTFAGDATFTRDDDAEAAGLRQWTLTLRALPYGRSVDLISDSAGTPPSDPGVLLNNCESTTGWSKWRPQGGGGGTGTSIAVDNAIYLEGAGSLRSQAEEAYTPDGITYYVYTNSDKITGLSLSTGTGGYLSVSVRTTHTGERTRLAEAWMTTAAGEVQVEPIASTRTADGWVRYVWPVAAALTVTGLRFTVYQYHFKPASAVGGFTWYDQISLNQSASADHQIVKQIDVKGSARTTASLRVAAPTAVVALGKVLAITTPTAEIPAGSTPDARRWITQGATTVDATSPDGSYVTPDATTYSAAAGKPIFDVPVGGLTPGPYTIVTLVKGASPIVSGVRAQLLIGSTLVGPTSEAEVSIPTADAGWQFVTVGTVYLPPLPMERADLTTKVRLLFKGALLSNVYMIPAWQKGGRPVADFSIVNCGAGTVGPGLASSSLWIDSPSVTQPQGGWWRGPTADRLNAQSAWPDAKKPGLHTFNPGLLTTFVVSTLAQGPTVTLDYYPAWLGAAAI